MSYSCSHSQNVVWGPKFVKCPIYLLEKKKNTLKKKKRKEGEEYIEYIPSRNLMVSKGAKYILF